MAAAVGNPRVVANDGERECERPPYKSLAHSLVAPCGSVGRTPDVRSIAAKDINHQRILTKVGDGRGPVGRPVKSTGPP